MRLLRVGPLHWMTRAFANIDNAFLGFKLASCTSGFLLSYHSISIILYSYRQWFCISKNTYVITLYCDNCRSLTLTKGEKKFKITVWRAILMAVFVTIIFDRKMFDFLNYSVNENVKRLIMPSLVGGHGGTFFSWIRPIQSVSTTPCLDFR